MTQSGAFSRWPVFDGPTPWWVMDRLVWWSIDRPKCLIGPSLVFDRLKAALECVSMCE
jgi:hypothetical protein